MDDLFSPTKKKGMKLKPSILGGGVCFLQLEL